MADSHGESFATIWRRRLISVPLIVVMLFLVGVLAPLLLPLLVLTDVIAGQARKRPRTRAVAFLGLYLFCEFWGVLIATVLWIKTLGGYLVGQARYRDLNAKLQAVWMNTILEGSFWIFGLTRSIEGVEDAAGPNLLFVRHSSSADTVLAAGLIVGPHKLRLRYVLKRALLWDPCLDIVGRRLRNAFVDRSGGRGLEPVRALAQELDAHSGVLIYPEGTRFSEAKKERSLVRLKERGLDELHAIASRYQHVLPPRIGGALALMEAAPDVDVVFLEHTGFEGAATFGSFWAGELVGKQIKVRVRRFRAAEIPTDNRVAWLYERWAELDAWVGEHRA